jgi:hypothetical protein
MLNSPPEEEAMYAQCFGGSQTAMLTLSANNAKIRIRENFMDYSFVSPRRESPELANDTIQVLLLAFRGHGQEKSLK